MSKKIKVLIVQGYAFQKGGVITFLEYLLNYLDKSKFTPVLLFLSEGELIDKFREKGVIVKVIHSGRLRNIIKLVITIFEIVILIKKEKIQVVFSNCTREYLYSGLACLFIGRPATFFWHGNAPGNLWARIFTLPPARVVFVGSKYTRRNLFNHLIPNTKLIYYGVELPLSKNPADKFPSMSKLRDKLGLPLNVPIITYVALFMKWKGQEYLIKAVPKILNVFPSTKFLLVGDAPFPQHKPYASFLKQLVKGMQLEENIIFTGYREDMLDIMKASDIIVYVSTSPEPYATVTLHALSVGKPLIATDIGGRREVIEDGKNGILIPTKNHDAIAEACIKLLRDPVLREKIGKCGREKIERYFKAERMVKEIGEVWTNLVNQ